MLAVQEDNANRLELDKTFVELHFIKFNLQVAWQLAVAV